MFHTKDRVQEFIVLIRYNERNRCGKRKAWQWLLRRTKDVDRYKCNQKCLVYFCGARVVVDMNYLITTQTIYLNIEPKWLQFHFYHSWVTEACPYSPRPLINSNEVLPLRLINASPFNLFKKSPINYVCKDYVFK